jgi:WD40 repeat protein
MYMSFFRQAARFSACSLGVMLIVACATPIHTPDHVYRDPGGDNLELGAAAWAPDGRHAAVANFDTIWVIEVESGELAARFSAQPDPEEQDAEARYRYGAGNTLLFMDNDRIATTGMRGNVAIASISDAAPVQSLPVPSLASPPIALAHSPATGALAVGGVNGSVVLLEPDGNGGFYNLDLYPYGGTVRDLQFSLKGDYLAASGHHPEIQIWNTGNLEPFGTLPVLDNVTEMALFPEGRRLLVAGEEMGIWYFLTGEQLEQIENPSMAGQRVALGAGTALLFALSIAAAAYGVGITPSVPSFDVRNGPCGRVAALSSDGMLLADRHPGVAKESIRIMDLEAYEVIKTLNPPGGATCDMAFSPDGAWLLLATEQVARLFDTTSWEGKDFNLPKPEEEEEEEVEATLEQDQGAMETTPGH